MFQLNSYKPKVQFHWLFVNKGKIIGRSILPLIIGIWLFLSTWTGMTAAVILNLLSVYFSRRKNVKKPLVYTSRIKRLFVSIFVLFIVVLIAAFFSLDENKLRVVVLFPICYLLLPLLVLLANLVNKPIEKSVNQWYINDAKKILASMPNLTVIGITGSYGKTSVKFYLSKLLSAQYNVLHTPESFNTPLGVVRTIRQELRAFHEIFVCEMGAKNIGDIKEICDIVHPKHGVITSIGPQHLESFLTVENVIKTKFELADSVPADGIAFLNYDNEYIRGQKKYKNIVSYGVEEEFNPTYLAYEMKTSSKGSTFKMKDTEGNEHTFTTKLIGKNNVENVAGAIAVANSLGIPMDKLIPQVKQLNPVEHRLQLIKRKDLVIIDDCYNSNPSGAKAALDTLQMFEGVKILLTPGMIELGSRQYECNKTFGTQAAAVCDYVVLVGENQTKPIFDGLVEAGFIKEKIHIVSNLQEGLKAVDSIKASGQEKVVLMENDLPDNY
jgi:UDP-N-acetylmuramoyl-tripeptide--D-alanyl-D-alanine ligase